MNGSDTDCKFIRDVPKRIDPLRPMRLIIEAELRRQFRLAEDQGFIGSELWSDAEAGPQARLVMILNLDDLAMAMIKHLNREN